MRKLIIGCVLLVACSPAAKNITRKGNVPKKQQTAKNAGLPYMTTYENFGDISIDTSIKKNP